MPKVPKIRSLVINNLSDKSLFLELLVKLLLANQIAGFFDV